jgi:hypothetical protein
LLRPGLLQNYPDLLRDLLPHLHIFYQHFLEHQLLSKLLVFEPFLLKLLCEMLQLLLLLNNYCSEASIVRVSTIFVGNLSKRNCFKLLTPFIKIADHIGSHQSSHVKFLILPTASVLNGDYLLINKDGGLALTRNFTVSNIELFGLNKDNFVLHSQAVLIKDKFLCKFIKNLIVETIVFRLINL